MWCMPIHRGIVWCTNILNECSMKLGMITTTDTLLVLKKTHTYCTSVHPCSTTIKIFICTYIGIDNIYVVYVDTVVKMTQ